MSGASDRETGGLPPRLSRCTQCSGPSTVLGLVVDGATTAATCRGPRDSVCGCGHIRPAPQLKGRAASAATGPLPVSPGRLVSRGMSEFTSPRPCSPLTSSVRCSPGRPSEQAGLRDQGPVGPAEPLPRTGPHPASEERRPRTKQPASLVAKASVRVYSLGEPACQSFPTMGCRLAAVG